LILPLLFSCGKFFIREFFPKLRTFLINAFLSWAVHRCKSGIGAILCCLQKMMMVMMMMMIDTYSIFSTQSDKNLSGRLENCTFLRTAAQKSNAHLDNVIIRWWKRWREVQRCQKKKKNIITAFQRHSKSWLFTSHLKQTSSSGCRCGMEDCFTAQQQRQLMLWNRTSQFEKL